MYDTIITLQQQCQHLRNKQKATGSDTRYAALDCQIHNIEKAIKALVLINNNPESFAVWANEQLDNQIAVNPATDSDSVSIFLRRQAE